MESPTQRQRLAEVLRARGIARLADLRRAGVTAATVGRLEREGAVSRLGRGLYQLASADTETHHALAEAARRIPKGVVCLVSALAFHGVTDEMPRKVWIAIGPKAWKPTPGDPPLREDYGGPRQAADGQRVTPDATDTKAPTRPRPSGGEVESGAPRENFGAPTHSVTDAEGQE